MDLNSYLSERGSQTRLAKAVNAQPQLVWQWANKIKDVPQDRAPDIERETAGAVPCEEMRPDVRWVRVADPDWPWHPLGRPLIDTATPKAKPAAEAQA